VGYKLPPQNPWPAAGGFVSVRAYAKINLFLDVLGKRDDGLHDIQSVIQPVELHDELRISINDENTEEKFTISCNEKSIPLDETNLIIKAAKLLDEKYNFPKSVHFDLNKKIPMGAGLAGGSANCAAALRGLNAFFDLNISKRKLALYGQTLGADVPFCVHGKTAFVEGFGEKVKELEFYPHCPVIIVCPDIFVSTSEIYSRLDSVTDYNKPPLGDHIEFLLEDRFIFEEEKEIADRFYNIFTPVTTEKHPEILEIIDELKSMPGVLNASMTGTGSAVFAYFNYDDKDNPKKVFDAFKDKYNTIQTKTI